MEGDGEGICGTSEALVAGLGCDARVAMKAVRNIRQIVLHMLVR